MNSIEQKLDSLNQNILELNANFKKLININQKKLEFSMVTNNNYEKCVLEARRGKIDFIPGFLLEDIYFISASLRNATSYDILSNIKNKNLIFNVIDLNPNYTRYLSEKWKMDEDIIMYALEAGYDYYEVEGKFKNKEFLMKMVKNDKKIKRNTKMYSFISRRMILKQYIKIPIKFDDYKFFTISKNYINSFKRLISYL